METLTNDTITITTEINCSYQDAWKYLENPMNQKEWGIHFFQDIEYVDNIHWATVPYGRVPLTLITDEKSGIIEIQLGDGPPIRTRLVDEGTRITYTFTLNRPEAMPVAVWNTEAIPNMKEELLTLKNLLENG